jgi:hypothetical protein
MTTVSTHDRFCRIRFSVYFAKLIQILESVHPKGRLVAEDILSKTEEDKTLAGQLLALLRGGQAHVSFEKAVADFPTEARGVVPDRLPYSAWQILEHLRITQKDILNFSAPPTGGYHAIKWPDDYWPKSFEPPALGDWDRTVDSIRDDLKKFEGLITRPGVDLYRPFLWGDGQNLLREALLIADHTAYHLGELIVIRRLLGIWQK